MYSDYSSHLFIADLSLARELPNGKLSIDESHRLLSPSLAGGTLLDLGIYSLTLGISDTLSRAS